MNLAKQPPRVPALSNWAHQALWDGGTKVQSNRYTPYAPYNALGDPNKTSPCLDTSSCEANLHEEGKMSLIISASAWNWE